MYSGLFSQEVKYVLFKWQLLDAGTNFAGGGRRAILLWHNTRGSDFLHSYLVRRALNAHVRYDDFKPHAAVAIRRVSERVCEETGAELKTTIEALCWPVMYDKFIFDTGTELLEFPPYDSDTDLLHAAAYLNLVPTMKRLLRNDDCFRGSVGQSLLPSPMILAGVSTIISSIHVSKLKSYL